MMDWLWSFIVNQIPWYWHVGILAVVIGVPVMMISASLIGWQATIRYVLGPVLIVIAALGAGSKIRQSGYNDRRAEEEKALDRAEEIVEHEKKDVQKLPDVEVDKEIDEWTRK